MKSPANKTAWLGTAEIALRYGMDPETIRNWIVRGVQTRQGLLRLRGLQVGRRWLVRRRWLREFMQSIDASQSVAPPVPPVEPVDRKQKRFAEEKRRLQERLDRRRKK